MYKYRVIGTLYTSIPKYYSWDKDKTFPYFDKLEEKEWEVEAESAKDAIIWLMNNYPEYYMGGSAHCITVGRSEFYMTAVPCLEYGNGNYETVDNRVAYLKQVLSRIKKTEYVA